MEIHRVLALANQTVRLDFLAMYRSLRATGCKLPVQVIPFDENKFDLPEGAEWIEDREFFEGLKVRGAVNHCRKLLALSYENVIFFDTDIIHLKPFESAFNNIDSRSFIVADPEWSIKKWTFSADTQVIFERETTTWPLNNFNSGFFAFENPILDLPELFDHCKSSIIAKLVQGGGPTSSEQEAANYLVFKSGRPIVNLCLPPHRMESTFCWDYTENNSNLLTGVERSPFFLHLVSKAVERGHDMRKLFFSYLSEKEKQEWNDQHPPTKNAGWPMLIRILNRIVKQIDPRFHVQPNSAAT